MHQAFKPKIYIIHVLFILMCPASAVPGRRPPSAFQLVCFIALKSIPLLPLNTICGLLIEPEVFRINRKLNNSPKRDDIWLIF